MNAHYFRSFFDVQATKEAQLDYARFARIEFREILKRFVQRHQIRGLLLSDLRCLFQGDPASATTA